MRTQFITKCLDDDLVIPKLGASPENRSLARGIAVLRAFRPGSHFLGNSEISIRTGIPKPTVTRLTQTLVRCRYLAWDHVNRAYKLGPAVLSLTYSMRLGCRLLNTASPLMQRFAATHQVNVGLAAPDGDEMVYIESFRFAKRKSLRTVTVGRRTPMELTSLGRAYLAQLPLAERNRLLRHFRHKNIDKWSILRTQLEDAFKYFSEHGFCMACWQPELVAVASPLVIDSDIYVINITISTPISPNIVISKLSFVLMNLKQQIEQDLMKSE